MFKDGVILPQCMPKGTAEYDGWLAKLLLKLPQKVENGTEGHEKWLAKLPQKVENGTEGHEKWLAKLPSKVENGTEGHEKWLAKHLAKTRGHYDNKHAIEHKDGTYLATCLECSAEPIAIDDIGFESEKKEKVRKVNCHQRNSRLFDLANMS